MPRSEIGERKKGSAATGIYGPMGVQAESMLLLYPESPRGRCVCRQGNMSANQLTYLQRPGRGHRTGGQTHPGNSRQVACASHWKAQVGSPMRRCSHRCPWPHPPCLCHALGPQDVAGRPCLPPRGRWYWNIGVSPFPCVAVSALD